MGNNCLHRRGDPMDPGSVLDKVIASTTASQDCILYQLADFRKGGKLVECFTQGGFKEANLNC